MASRETKVSEEPGKGVPSTVTRTVWGAGAWPWGARQEKTVLTGSVPVTVDSWVRPTTVPSTLTVAEPWLPEKGAMRSRPTPVKVYS